jgi:hypothetical protein
LHPDPITDPLDAADFLAANPPAHERIRVLYKCRCGNKLELHISAEAVVCIRCGSRMRAQP